MSVVNASNANAQIHRLSYFYDRIAPLGIGADSKPFSIATLKQLTSDVCQGDRQITTKGILQPGWARFKGSSEAMAELKGRPEYCLDLTFMYSLLNLGYELSEDRELRTGKQIDDVELGWCLGQSLVLSRFIPETFDRRCDSNDWRIFTMHCLISIEPYSHSPLSQSRFPDRSVV